MKVLDNIVSFKWIRPEDSNHLLMSDEFYKVELRPFKIYQGEAIEVGTSVKFIKPGDRFLIEEYGIENFNGSWKENEIYFTKESEIKIKLEESFNGHIRIISSDEWNKVK